MATQSKNRCSPLYCYGFQGKHELIEPTVEDSHSAGELSVDVDPASSTFFMRVLFKFSQDAASTATTTLNGSVAGTSLNFYRLAYSGAREVQLYVELFGTPGALCIKYYSNTEPFSTGDIFSKTIAYTHSPGTPFTIDIVDGGGLVIDNAADKFAFVVGG